MSNAHASTPQDARDVLRQVESVERQTRSVLHAFWFPLIVFGILTLLSAPVQWAWSGATVAAFWAVAGPLGGAAVGWYYRSRELRLGLSVSATPYVITAVGLLAGSFVLPMLTTGRLQEVVSVFAVAAGYLVFAWLDRSRALAGLAIFIAAVPVLVLLSDVDQPGAIAAAVIGTVVLGTGVVSRHRA
jgi:hypothetical protein